MSWVTSGPEDRRRTDLETWAKTEYKNDWQYAYHFMLNSVATYLRALGSLASSCWGGLWVGSGLVGIPSSPTLPLPASGKTLQRRGADPPTTGHYLLNGK